MAIYKSTHCYPFLNTVDIRVSKTSASSTYPAQYLKCKVDTSNKTVTGYKIRILDNDNNQIFPPADGKETISPIYELRTDHMDDLYKDNGTNSGINGTYLQIPFFQTRDDKKLLSYNAIYYKPQFSVDHIILTSSLATALGIPSLQHSDNINNWELKNGVLEYIWPSYELIKAQAQPGQTIVETTYPLYGTEDSVFYTDNTQEYDINSYDYDNRKNRIRVNGEVLNSDQIILVASDNASDKVKTGFYVVRRVVDTSTDNPVYSTILVPLSKWNQILNTANSTTDILINVKKGDLYHNKTVKYNNELYSASTETALWYCYRVKLDNTIEECDLPNFNVNGTTYKWEITLYQGDIQFSGDHTSNQPFLGMYDGSIDAKDFDMVIGSGSILGSSSSRIQIASGGAFVGNLPNKESIIPGLKSGTLVLQGRYMAMTFSSSNNELFSSNRVYVQTYDATYGHVYPAAGDVTSNMVDNSNLVQFYKYSNNPEHILNTDIVEYGTVNNVNVNYTLIYNQDSVAKSGTIEQFTTEDTCKASEHYSIVNFYLQVSPTSAPFNRMQPGNKILLTGQSEAKQNGVYEYKHITAYNGSTSNEIYYLTRAASYDTWASYIGKIIYCSNYFYNNSGDSQSRNIESLANAGTFQLWNLNNTNSGDSNLFFTNEIPILLFEEKIKNNRTYDLYYTSNTPPENLNTPIDGIYPSNGNILLANNGNVYRAENGTWVLHNSDDQGNQLNPEISDYCSILSGQNYGKRIIRWGEHSPAQVSWALHTATILKNTPTSTYISPFVNLSEGMLLKFKNNKSVYITNSVLATAVANETDYIVIRGINPRLFCIAHSELKTSNGQRMSLISEFSSEANTPWKYETRSYFKASDENPFYSYENPYLLLYKNNVEYSDLATLVEEREFMVTNPPLYDEFLVKENSTTSEQANYIFITGIFKDASIVTGRCVKLAAKYKQFEGLSWESYRWTLRDKSGNVLQDTGKKYDKTIGVIFYGLSNDKAAEFVIYYATLYLTDTLGNTLEYILQLKVAAGESSALLSPLEASYDDSLHAVKLIYQDNGLVAPAYTVSGVDKAYTEEHSIFDNDVGLLYYHNGSDDSSVTITHKNRQQNAVVNFDTGSTITPQAPEHLYSDTISLPEQFGLNYYTSFNSSLEEHTNDTGVPLSLTESISDMEHHGHMYLETEFTLHDNFTADILEWKIQGNPNEVCENPSAPIDGSTVDNLGYVVFKLTMPDELLNDHMVANPNRNKIQLQITSYSGGENKTPTNNNYLIKNIDLFTLKPKGNTIKSLYYLQPTSSINGAYADVYQSADYEYLRYNLGTSYIYLQQDKNNNYYIGGTKFLGNLCLSPSIGTSSCFTYWDETRPYLRAPIGQGSQLFLDPDMLVQKLYSTRDYHSDNGVQCWPDNDENDSYWYESSMGGNPTFVSDIMANNTNVVQVQPLNRHYTMSNYKYHITCKITDILYLYEHLNSLTIYEEQIDDGVTLYIGSNEKTPYCSISILQTANEEV